MVLGNRRLASDAVVTLEKGGGQIALEDASSDGTRYLGGGYIALSEVVEEALVSRQQVQSSMELSMRMLRVHRRAGPSMFM